MSRPIDISDLPDDVTALRAVIGTLLADLSAEWTARRAAEAGLRDKALEAEHLRAQLARLRRIQFGQSSERLRDQIAQLGDLQPDHHGEAEAAIPRRISVPC
jgi:transposase